MKHAISIKTKCETLVFVLPMLVLFILNGTIVVAEDVRPSVEMLPRIKALEKRVQAIQIEINDLKSQAAGVDGQLSESTILGTWLFQKASIKCQLVFKPNHSFQITTSDPTQGIVNASGHGNWTTKGSQVIVEYRYDGPQIVVPDTTLLLTLTLPDTMTAHGITYRKQPAKKSSPNVTGVTHPDAKISIELSKIPDHQKPHFAVALGYGLKDIELFNIPSGFEPFAMLVRAHSGAEEYLKPGDTVSVLSYPSRQSKDNKRLVVVVPEAKLFSLIKPDENTNIRIAVLLTRKGKKHFVNDEDMGELHLVRQLATNE